MNLVTCVYSLGRIIYEQGTKNSSVCGEMSSPVDRKPGFRMGQADVWDEKRPERAIEFDKNILAGSWKQSCN